VEALPGFRSGSHRWQRTLPRLARRIRRGGDDFQRSAGISRRTILVLSRWQLLSPMGSPVDEDHRGSADQNNASGTKSARARCSRIRSGEEAMIPASPGPKCSRNRVNTYLARVCANTSFAVTLPASAAFFNQVSHKAGFCTIPLPPFK
jgi:hypothetical protein